MYNIKGKSKAVIISDSAPLIDLCDIENGFALLRKCFKPPVYIPAGVYEEVEHEEERAVLDSNVESGFVKVIDDFSNEELQDIVDLLSSGLHKGESQAIALIGTRFSRESSELLIQDSDAIERCRLRGIDTTGSLGIVLYAHKEKLISKKEAMKYIDDIAEANMFIGGNKNLVRFVKGEVLKQERKLNKDMDL